MGTATTTTTLTPLMKTYYDRKLLEFAEPIMVADKLADHSRDIPQKEGKTVNFTRYVPLDKITEATAEGSNPDYVEMEAFNFEKTVAKYANSIRLTEEVQLTAYDDVLDGAVMLQGINMGESINYQYRKAMALGFYPMRVDNSTTYAKTGAVTTSTSTTVICDTSLTQADHFWADGLIIFTSGQNAGSAHLVTAFDATDDKVTFTPALKEKADVGDTFRIVVTTDLADTNVVTCAAVERAVAILKNNKAPKYDGKNYVGIISPFVTYDFMQDSAWVNAKHYASPQDILNGELGKWGGVRWYEDTEAWKELINDGTAHESTQDRGFGLYSASGTINHTPIFGKHALAGTRISGVKDKLIIKVSGPQDTSNATNAFSLVSWRVYFVGVVLNGLFGVNILSGASTVA
ncbi:MAG TPA: N4-gp56 family major capsid protein [Candidatus Atribacteria bacterium]|nr:N4-gp56 family major capsid protein [Candidatus Atribacteria bacterium]